MKREWKPGDVALCIVHGHPVVRTKANQWLHEGYDRVQYLPDRNLRPLVVIDPEDREQVERLAAACLTKFGWSGRGPSEDEIAATQAALRSLVTPPIPEPTLIGAVISDKRGTKYVRVSVAGDALAHGKEWQQVGGSINAVRNFGWNQLDVAEVLYGGWTPDASGGAS